MVNATLARIPAPLKVGLPLAAAALVAAACSSSGGSGNSGSAAAAAGGNNSGGNTASAVVIKATPGSSSPFLTDASGQALYMWDADKNNMSSCAGACATQWPPLTTKGTPMASGGSVKVADLGTITRSDGTKQVTYDGHPLYKYTGDTGPGKTTGQGSAAFGAKWWLVAPTGKVITAADSATSAGASAPSSSASSSSSASNGGSSGSGAGGAWG